MIVYKVHCYSPSIPELEDNLLKEEYDPDEFNSWPIGYARTFICYSRDKAKELVFTLKESDKEIGWIREYKILKKNHYEI